MIAPADNVSGKWIVWLDIGLFDPIADRCKSIYTHCFIPVKHALKIA